MKTLHIELDLVMPDVKAYNLVAHIAIQAMKIAVDNETNSTHGTTEVRNLKITEL